MPTIFTYYNYLSNLCICYTSSEINIIENDIQLITYKPKEECVRKLVNLLAITCLCPPIPPLYNNTI